MLGRIPTIHGRITIISAKFTLKWAPKAHFKGKLHVFGPNLRVLLLNFTSV